MIHTYYSILNIYVYIINIIISDDVIVKKMYLTEIFVWSKILDLYNIIFF